MATFYARTYDLTKLFLSLEKDHFDIVALDITDPDEDDDVPPTLFVQGVNTADTEDFGAYEDTIDSDESLADYF